MIQPTLIETLTKLRNNGALQQLYSHGLISHKPYLCIDIYFKVESLSLQMSRTSAISLVALSLGLSKRSISSLVVLCLCILTNCQQGIGSN